MEFGLGQALAVPEPNGQGQGYWCRIRQADDAEAADLQQPGQARGRLGLAALHVDLVICHERETYVKQAKEKIGLARTGLTEDQHTVAVPGPATGMKQHSRIFWARFAAMKRPLCWAWGAVFHVKHCARHPLRQAAFGSRTVNRAPTTLPASSRRFSATIRPLSASTIWRLIDSPRPECCPNCSAGRSE